ncbi:MAG: citrate (Si)-synthase [Saprospiraceae bacterium]|nr:citrate (Si)-synthase [Saprospiraceae bacterium]HMW39603.1 citrate (Si)-synthase [Saprospiraceae bacterium]HMX89328.1 citrate (Si)-synthase [Saprospiraceae bacterium]HMZ41216.1 citrate (Si)-synthase [Saprospiraceae bacterium]HNA65311.1 citrate (Si)-synthase [Saprospiraceae bacterium]
MDILKEAFKLKFAAKTEELKDLIKANFNVVIDKVKVEQLHGGMRGIKLMLWDTSSLDPVEGIRFRGYSIPELREKLPRINGAREPMPEGLFWLMLTGDLPTEEQVAWVSRDWQDRSTVNPSVFRVLDSLENNIHPMTQFSIGIMAMQSDSLFARKYDEGMPKSKYWEYMYEDSVNLIARLPRIAAYIYRKNFHNNQHIAPDPNLDWSANFGHMMGNRQPDFMDLMRLYMTIHADHEGGNASAHTVHLIGSTLSDAYLSLSGGINALAGPLHGLANQEVMDWIAEMVVDLGTNRPTREQIQDYVKKTLSEGKIVPGYGHAVLRAPDPRFLAQKEFAQKYCADDALVNIVWNVFEVVPPILEDLGKVKNPWPNVDAHSGALLEHYGINEHNFYTVLFGVSRAMGVLAQLCWDRAYGLPLERPKSLTTEELKEIILQAANV